jgi:hypothetical protein
MVTFAAHGSLRVTCSSWPDAVVIRSGRPSRLHVTEIDTPPCLPLGRLSRLGSSPLRPADELRFLGDGLLPL